MNTSNIEIEDEEEVEELEQELTEIEEQLAVQQNASGSGYNDTLGSMLGGLSQQQTPESNLLMLLEELAAQQSQTSTQPSSDPPFALSYDSTETTPQTQDDSQMIEYAKKFDVNSWGDPHIATNVDGQTSTSNNMQSQSNLINLNNSIEGGYQVSTKVTKPDSNGITYNKSATVTLDNGVKATDTLKDGKQSITVKDGNLKETLTAGQTIKFGKHESVTDNADGTMTVNADAPYGTSVQTNITLTADHQGLDVDTSGQNAYIGGFGAQQADNNQLQWFSTQV